MSFAAGLEVYGTTGAEHAGACVRKGKKAKCVAVGAVGAGKGLVWEGCVGSHEGTWPCRREEERKRPLGLAGANEQVWL